MMKLLQCRFMKPEGFEFDKMIKATEHLWSTFTLLSLGPL